MKRIILYCFLAFCLLQSAFALEDFVYLNDTVTNATVYLGLTFTENATVFINMTESDDRLNITYPRQINFTNFTEYDVPFKINVTGFFIGNETVNSTFNITNSLNFNSYKYTIVTNVYSPENIVEKDEFFINVVNGDYVLNISKNLLPRSGELAYEIAGLIGETLKISCPHNSWLTCPDHVVFNSSNLTSFNIDYTIPASAGVNQTVYRVNFSSKNLSTYSRVIFNVLEPSIIFEEYILDESCIRTEDDNSQWVDMDCYIQSQIFAKHQLYEMYEYLKRDSKENCTKEIEHLYVGNIEKDVVEELERCRDDRDTFSSENTEYRDYINKKDEDYMDCQNSLSTCEVKLRNNETACLQSVFDASVRMKKQADEQTNQSRKEARDYRIATWGWILFILVIIAFIVFIVYALQQGKKEGI